MFFYNKFLLPCVVYDSRISIYNRSAYLDRALETIYQWQQEYGIFEAIIGLQDHILEGTPSEFTYDSKQSSHKIEKCFLLLSCCSFLIGCKNDIIKSKNLHNVINVILNEIQKEKTILFALV